MILEEHHSTLYPENVGAFTCTTRDEIRRNDAVRQE
jgi:hypothetical protein